MGGIQLVRCSFWCDGTQNGSGKQSSLARSYLSILGGLFLGANREYVYGPGLGRWRSSITLTR